MYDYIYTEHPVQIIRDTIEITKVDTILTDSRYIKILETGIAQSNSFADTWFTVLTILISILGIILTFVGIYIAYQQIQTNNIIKRNKKYIEWIMDYEARHNSKANDYTFMTKNDFEILDEVKEKENNDIISG
jgi:hypothetical protein